jgi:hypothetical protein
MSSKSVFVDFIAALVGKEYNASQRDLLIACPTYKTAKCNHYDGETGDERAVNLSAANITLVICNLFVEYSKQECNFGGSDSVEGELRLFVNEFGSPTVSPSNVIDEWKENDELTKLSSSHSSFDMTRAIGMFASAIAYALWTHVMIKVTKTTSIDGFYCALALVCRIRRFQRTVGLLETFSRIKQMKAPNKKKTTTTPEKKTPEVEIPAESSAPEEELIDF